MCGNKCIDPTIQCCVSNYAVGKQCPGSQLCVADGDTCSATTCPSGTAQCGKVCFDNTADATTGIKQCCVASGTSTVGNEFNGACYPQPYCPIFFQARASPAALGCTAGQGGAGASTAASAGGVGGCSPCRVYGLDARPPLCGPPPSTGAQHLHQGRHRGQEVPQQPRRLLRVLRRQRLPGPEPGPEVRGRHVLHVRLHHLLLLERPGPPGVQAGPAQHQRRLYVRGE